MRKEIQYFRQLWILVILIFVTAIPIFGLVYQLTTGNPFGNNPMPNWGYIPLLILLLGLDLMFWKANLTTTYNAKGISYRFVPFHFSNRSILWKDVDQITIRKYSPIKEYGGWGLRGFGKNRAFNVSGNIGVQIHLKDGHKILFGTQDWKAIAEVLELHKITYNTNNLDA